VKQIFVLALAACLLQLAGGNAAARGRPDARAAQVSVELIDDRGRRLPVFPAASEAARIDRAYVEARPQAGYSVRVYNPTDVRIGVVIAVDGRNIISGARSELAAGEAMYVIEPRQTAVYSGWRTSADEIRRFYFSELDDSYASRIGDESAIGVVAAAVFESRREHEARVARDDGAAAAAPKAAAEADASGRAERSSRAGTGFGDAARSHSVRVAFMPEREPSRRIFLKYEWEEQLCLRKVKRCDDANRFWPDVESGFVPLPPGPRG
jgi:hypothetical protein